MGHGLNLFGLTERLVTLLNEYHDRPKDYAGSAIVRAGAASKGRAMNCRNFNFTTSTLASLINNKVDGTGWGDTTIKFYNSAGTELTVQGTIDTDCVETHVDFMPTEDYEIIGGSMNVPATLAGADDYAWYVWAVAAPGLSDHEFCSNKCLQPYKGGSTDMDGRASKVMLYNNPVAGTSKIRFVLKHPEGAKSWFQFQMFIYTGTIDG